MLIVSTKERNKLTIETINAVSKFLTNVICQEFHGMIKSDNSFLKSVRNALKYS